MSYIKLPHWENLKFNSAVEALMFSLMKYNQFMKIHKSEIEMKSYENRRTDIILFIGRFNSLSVGKVYTITYNHIWS